MPSETKERPFFVRNSKGLYALKFWLKGRPSFDAHILMKPEGQERPHHMIGLRFFGGSATYEKRGLIVVIEPVLVEQCIMACQDFVVPRAPTYDDDLRADDDGMAPTRERA